MGYDVSEELTPIISVSDFNSMTNNAYSGNPRIEAALKAASQAIRNFCGWHITPALTCTVNPAGGAAVLRLPATYVSAITRITVEGVQLESGDYEWRKDGLIRHKDMRPWSAAWDGIEAVYTAGYAADAVPDLADAVCAIASGVLAVSAGIVSESADGVSISYSASRHGQVPSVWETRKVSVRRICLSCI